MGRVSGCKFNIKLHMFKWHLHVIAALKDFVLWTQRRLCGTSLEALHVQMLLTGAALWHCSQAVATHCYLDACCYTAFMDFATGTTRSLNSVHLYMSVCSFLCATATLPYHLLFQILKFEWPRNWPTFISDIVGASKTNESLCQNNMIILKLLR